MSLNFAGYHKREYFQNHVQVLILTERLLVRYKFDDFLYAYAKNKFF